MRIRPKTRQPPLKKNLITVAKEKKRKFVAGRGGGQYSISISISDTYFLQTQLFEVELHNH